MNILVAVLGGNWSMVEAEHPGIDLLDLSFRKLLNISYSWLRRHTSPEDWKREYQNLFMADRNVQKRMDKRAGKIRRGKPGGRATLSLKRDKPPAQYKPALAHDSGGDSEPADS